MPECPTANGKVTRAVTASEPDGDPSLHSRVPTMRRDGGTHHATGTGINLHINLFTDTDFVEIAELNGLLSCLVYEIIFTQTIQTIAAPSIIFCSG